MLVFKAVSWFHGGFPISREVRLRQRCRNCRADHTKFGGRRGGVDSLLPRVRETGRHLVVGGVLDKTGLKLGVEGDKGRGYFRLNVEIHACAGRSVR